MQKQTKQRKRRKNRRKGRGERQRKNEPMCPPVGDELNKIKY